MAASLSGGAARIRFGAITRTLVNHLRVDSSEKSICRMREILIEIPSRVSAARVLRAAGAALRQSKLRIIKRGTLKTCPGSTHWHLKNGEQRGTLELTWWPAKRRLWFKIQSGRSAEWIDPAILRLQADFR